MDIFGRKKKKREAILKYIKEVTRNGQCVILGQTPQGTRVIVLGQPSVLNEAEEILRSKEEYNE